MAKKRARPAGLPQHYLPRVEIAVETLASGIRGLMRTAEYLVAQAGADWRDRLGLLDAAEADLKEALRWLGKRRVIGGGVR